MSDCFAKFVGMIFNSLQFLCFFPAVCLVYFLLPGVRSRNVFLLLASYWFYMNWQPGYALLLAGVSTTAYFAARLMDRHRDVVFYSALILIFGTLFLFKYLAFAGTALRDAMSLAGITFSVPDFGIVLPVGISFFTFQTVGYLIDVRRGTVRAERDFIDFSLFVAFFPQLVAGPIERSSDMMPQFRRLHRFSYSRFLDGTIIMLCGYFLKLVLADHCSEYVDAVHAAPANHNGATALVAAVLFSFQIFGDFAGYSLIALGAAKVMGFRLTRNFDSPYRAATVTEFWRRWHISLSRWLRDYVYIPLGGSRRGKRRTYINLMLTFIISGIWHGAAWQFLLWGAMHGGAVCLDRATSDIRTRFRWLCYVGVPVTFLFVTFAWIFFRSPDVAYAFGFISKIFTAPGKPWLPVALVTVCVAAVVSLPLVTRIERHCYGRDANVLEAEQSAADDGALELRLFSASVIGRQLLIALLGAVVVLFGSISGNGFIYFQF